MHRSRLAAFVIDCQVPDLDDAARFWSAALGKPVKPPPHFGDNYRSLATAPGELTLEVQRVEHPSRVHLDIETDDLEAEVQRLEKLGATRVVQIKHWWVMEAPTGQRFCVLGRKPGSLEGSANSWDAG